MGRNQPSEKGELMATIETTMYAAPGHDEQSRSR